MNLTRGAASKRNAAHRREGDKKGQALLKSYNGLYERMMEPEEIQAAIREAARGKKRRRNVQRALDDLPGKAKKIRASIERPGGWRPPKHKAEPRQDGSHKKMRMIQKPRWDDEQIIHHMLMRQLRPIITRSLYRYACGSIPGRGTHFALRTMKRWRDGYRGRKFYVAELDIRHFYDSIQVERLKAGLDRTIRDRRYKALLFRVTDGGGPGLPKGFYTSPWLSHYFLTPLDYYIVQQLRPDHYLRYVDNLFLFSGNKKELHKMVRKISGYLTGELGLELKDDWQVFRFEGENRRTGKVTGRAVNCLGFVLHRNRVTIRKSILKRIRRKANRIDALGRYRRNDAAAMLSYLGYFKHSDTYGYYLKHIKPKVSIQYCKRRISALDRKKARKQE